MAKTEAVKNILLPRHLLLIPQLLLNHHHVMVASGKRIIPSSSSISVETMMSLEKALQAAVLKTRFAGTIHRATQTLFVRYFS